MFWIDPRHRFVVVEVYEEADPESDEFDSYWDMSMVYGWAEETMSDARLPNGYFNAIVDSPDGGALLCTVEARGAIRNAAVVRCDWPPEEDETRLRPIAATMAIRAANHGRLMRGEPDGGGVPQ